MSGNLEVLTGSFFQYGKSVVELEFRANQGPCLLVKVDEIYLYPRLLWVKPGRIFDAVLSSNGDFFVLDGDAVYYFNNVLRLNSVVARDALKVDAWAGIPRDDYDLAVGFVDQMRLNYLASHAVLSVVLSEKQGGLQHIDAAIDALSRLRQLRGVGVVV